MRHSILTAYIILITAGLILPVNSNFCFAQNTNKDAELELIYKSVKFEYDTISNVMKKTDNYESEKSPYLGGAMSLVIPGAGQFYAKDYWKTAIFLLVEAGLWTTYGIYQKKGNDQTTSYQNYANSNWNVRQFADWLKRENFSSSGSIEPNTPNLEILRAQINVCLTDPANNFTHTLPEYGAQQYYEVIGKYQTFIAGWSTADLNYVTRNTYGTYRLSQVDYYMNERQLANDYYKNGDKALYVVILNHLLSAAEAAWSITRHNKEISFKTNFEVKNLYSVKHNRYSLTPFVNLSVNF